MKKLWVATVGACLLALAGASLAPAAEFRAGSYPANVLIGQGGELAPKPPAGTGGGGGGAAALVFGFEGALMTSCGTAEFEGQLAAPSASLSTSAVLGVCAAFGFTTATINTNGCSYVFNAGAGSEGKSTGTVDISCPAGKVITVSGGNCEIQIGTQTGIGPISYASQTEKGAKVVTVGFESKASLQYTKTKDGFACPLNGTGFKTDGLVVGGATAKTSSGIWIE